MLEVNFSPFPILESERLLFRTIKDTDVNEIFALRSNPDLMKYVPRPLATSLEDAQKHIQVINDKIIANEAINWAMTEKGNDKLIGVIGYHYISNEHYRAEIGYMILSEYQNKGYVSEAINTIINFGFNQMKLNAVEAIIDPRNLASEKVLLKNKFIKEAHFKESFHFNGTFLDSAHYSILKRNYSK